jgi:hypothetical protein
MWRQSGGALAASGLPDEAHALAFADGERDAVDSTDVGGAKVKFGS